MADEGVDVVVSGGFSVIGGIAHGGDDEGFKVFVEGVEDGSEGGVAVPVGVEGGDRQGKGEVGRGAGEVDPFQGIGDALLEGEHESGNDVEVRVMEAEAAVGDGDGGKGMGVRLDGVDA